MKIYEFNGFPNPARVRIALGEKEMLDQVEFVSINVPDGEHRSPAYLKLNPSGTVPALELDDGTIISECSAITEYLDAVHGSPVLTGISPKQRAVIHMMQRRAEAMLLDAAGDYFHQATPGLGPDLEGNQCAEWGEKQRERAITGMHYFDSVLSSQSYVAGDQFTVADITVFAGLMFAGFGKIDVPTECTNLLEWHERVSNRPSVTNSIAN